LVGHIAKELLFRQVDHAESLVEQQQRHIQENLSLQQRLEEAETERNQLERELASARDRLERTRKDNMQVSKGLKGTVAWESDSIEWQSCQKLSNVL